MLITQLHFHSMNSYIFYSCNKITWWLLPQCLKSGKEITNSICYDKTILSLSWYFCLSLPDTTSLGLGSYDIRIDAKSLGIIYHIKIKTINILPN